MLRRGDARLLHQKEGRRSVTDPPKLSPLGNALLGIQAEIQRMLSQAPRKIFTRQFAHHTERGAALVAVASLDETLKRTIIDNLIQDQAASSVLFGDTGPLGAFGLRIRLGYLMGLYNSTVYQDLLTIAKIRNTFAHQPGSKDFSEQQIKSWVTSMSFVKWLRAEVKNQKGSEALKVLQEICSTYDLTKIPYQFMAICLLLEGLVSSGTAKVDINKSARFTD
jgi:DNA-binding MltR family transcriptional regulator